MSGVEKGFVKNSETNFEVYNSHDPQNFEEALQEFTIYCERQLPVQLDLSFVPSCFDISQREDSLVLGGIYGNIASFDIKTKQVLRDEELTPGFKIVSVLVVLNDSQVVAINELGELHIMEFPSFELLFKLACAPGPAILRQNIKNSILYLTNGDEVLQIISLSTEEDFYAKKFYKKVTNYPSAITALDVSDDSSLLAIGFQSGIITIIHSDTWKALKSTEDNNAVPTILAFSESHQHIAAGFSDYSVRLWILDSSLTLKFVFNKHSDAITGLTFVKENKFLLTSSLDTNINLWDTKVESLPYSMNLQDLKVTNMKVCKDYKTVYYTQELDCIMCWCVPQLPKNARYRGHVGKINKILFIPHTFELISISDDGKLKIWDYRIDSLQETLKLEGSLTDAVMTQSGSLAIIYSTKPCIYKLNLNNNRVDEMFLQSAGISIALSIDESMLAISDLQSRVKIYDLKTLEVVSIIKGHTAPVISCGFIEADGFLITASRDYTLGRWETMSSVKTHTFYGHESLLTALLITNDNLIISASEDGLILLWNYEAILQYTLTSSERGAVKSLYLTENHNYLISLQSHRLTYWELNNLSIVFQIDTIYDAVAFDVSRNEKFLALAEADTVYIEENAIGCSSIRIRGKSQSSPHKFMRFVVDSQKESSKATYSMNHNHWAVAPYMIGPAHILASTNRFIDLNRALIFPSNKANFFSTIQNENPLSLCVAKEYKNCIDICLKYMKSISIGKNGTAPNLRAYHPLESCITDLNKIEYPYIAKLYGTIFIECSAVHLPQFCLHDSDLPSLYLSDHMVVFPEELISKENFSSTGRPVVFSMSTFPLDLDTGTAGSIEFIESLLNCSDQEIFRSAIVKEYLLCKWKRVKPAVYGLGFTYIFYLILLALYIVIYIESKEFLMLLTIVHVILWAYEILQIATDFSGYWNTVWNILDQLRSLSLTFYVIMAWQDNYNQDILLSVLIFSWTRGIGNFRMFDETRYMVRLIIQVILDIRTFFLILGYSTLAFAFVFYLRAPDSQPFPMFITLAYRLDLGDFNTDLTEPFDWILFFISTMINPLIMLNLLIAIMSDTAAAVAEVDDILGLRELAEMIIDVEKVMFWKRALSHKHYLHKCDFVTAEETDNDKVLQKVKFIKKQAVSISKTIKNIKKSVSKMVNSQIQASVTALITQQDHMKEDLTRSFKQYNHLVFEINKNLKIS